jgi:hypothetical protein
MNKKVFLLIGGIVSLLVFVGSLAETGPESWFGFSINIWLIRAFWLFNTLVIFNGYRTLRQAEKK